MFNIFKNKKIEKTEFDLYKPFLKNDYNYLIKIYFPILIYPDLPSKPVFENWQENQLYIIKNFIPSSFVENFEKQYSLFEGERFEITQKDNKVESNLSKQILLVRNWLESQRKMLILRRELDDLKYKEGDLNVFVQKLDHTPREILKLVLEVILYQFNNANAKIIRHTGVEEVFSIKELLTKLESFELFHFLDQLYDVDRKWQLIQPEESTFLLVATKAKELFNQLEKINLEIELIKRLE